MQEPEIWLSVGFYPSFSGEKVWDFPFSNVKIPIEIAASPS
jgi:hypothetical protein